MKKIGLALGSGGWRGLAHVGVIKCLVEHGFEIATIAGCSSGALVGGAYAATKNIEKIEQTLGKLSIKDLFLTLSDPGLSTITFKGYRSQLIFEGLFGKHTIEKMPINFCAVATDILTTKPVILKKGDLAKAVRTSSSFPMIFKPVSSGKYLLIDGGASLPVPVSIAKKMGAEVVIAVNLYEKSFPQKAKSINRLSVFTITQQLILNNLSLPELALADIVINPILKNSTNISVKQFMANQDAINAGYIAMKAKIKSLEKLVNEKVN